MNIRYLLISIFVFGMQSCFGMKKDVTTEEVLAGLVNAAHSNSEERFMMFLNQKNNGDSHSKKDHSSKKRPVKNIKGNTDTSLHLSVQQDNIELTRFLLSKGAGINEKGRHGHTPLFRAISRKCSDGMVDLLLVKGADPNIQDDNGNTCFVAAGMANCSPGIVSLLCDYEEQQKKIVEAAEAQFISAIEKSDIGTIDILLAYGINVNAISTDDGCSSALQEAVRYLRGPKGLAIIIQLIQYGADVNFKNKFSSTALSYALCYHTWEDAAEILIEHEATMPTIKGATMLHLAAKEGFVKIVNILLKKNGCHNSTDDFGNTALMLACAADRLEIVRLLLEAGASINGKNRLGYDVFVLARFNKECLELLHTEEEKRLKRQ